MRRIFWGFCINWFGIRISPLHYISSRYDFGFEFLQIFIIEKRLPVDKIACSYNFFKPLNKSMVIVHYIPGLFFAKLVL
jgi:hypothetical protein